MLYHKTNKGQIRVTICHIWIPAMPCVWYVRGSAEFMGATVNIGRGEFLPAPCSDFQKMTFNRGAGYL